MAPRLWLEQRTYWIKTNCHYQLCYRGLLLFGGILRCRSPCCSSQHEPLSRRSLEPSKIRFHLAYPERFELSPQGFGDLHAASYNKGIKFGSQWEFWNLDPYLVRIALFLWANRLLVLEEGFEPSTSALSRQCPCHLCFSRSLFGLDGKNRTYTICSQSTHDTISPHRVYYFKNKFLARTSLSWTRLDSPLELVWRLIGKSNPHLPHWQCGALTIKLTRQKYWWVG